MNVISSVLINLYIWLLILVEEFLLGHKKKK